MSASVVQRPSPKRIDAPAPLADRADRLEHVRRRLAAGAARGSRRHREVAERHQQRLALDAVEADVEVVRQPPLASEPFTRTSSRPARSPVEQPIAQRRQPRGLVDGISGRQISAAAPRPTMPGTLSVPERRPFS